MSKIIVILGPTASGKSELAVKIAKKFNGEIISADSRQVYKGLNIGAGKVPRDKISNFQFLISKQIPNSKSQIQKQPYFYYKGIRHRLLDVASPKRTFAVAQYQLLAKKALVDILKRGKLPIICGGTGLYIDALIHDYKLPEVPPQPKLRKQLEKKSTEELFKKLQKLDPRRAKNIDKNNRRRLIRALEIIITTKKPVPLLASASLFNILKIGIKKSPEELKKLIAARLKKRLQQGLIKEVKNLHNGSGLSPEGKPSASYGVNWKRLNDLGLEYRYVSRYLQNLITKEEIEKSILKESWQYAKRQMTWFKKDKNILWIKNEKGAFEAVKRFLFN